MRAHIAAPRLYLLRYARFASAPPRGGAEAAFRAAACGGCSLTTLRK